MGAGNGYISGIVLTNSWNGQVHHIYGYGNGTTYDDGNGGHAGNGTFLRYNNLTLTG